jgi:hypothetical protein
MVVVDLPREFESLAQGELAMQDVQSSRAQLHPPILTRLGRVLVNSRDARFGDIKCPPRRVEIRDQ